MPLEPFGKDKNLFNAVVNGDLAALASIHPSREEINSQFSLEEDYGMGYEDLSLLMVAAGSPSSNVETVQWLLDNGADVELKSQMRTMAPWYAVAGIPKAFLDKSIDRDEGANWMSDKGGDAARLRLFLDAGADPNEPCWVGRCMLYEAASRGDLDMVNLLIERGADPLGQDPAEGDAFDFGDMFRPLVAAAGSGSVPCVKAILDAGVPADGYGVSTLAAAGNADVARFLIAQGGTMEGGTGWGNDILDSVFEDGRLDVARVLIENGATLEADRWGASRAHALAGVNMNPAALKLFIEMGGKYDVPSYLGGTILHTACWQGDGNNGRPTDDVRETVEYLISLGVPLDAKDQYGQTALHEAVHGDWGSPTSVEVLLRHGADPNLRDNNGLTPLMVAAEWGEAECLRLLLEHGADPSAKKGLKKAMAFAKQRKKLFEKIIKDDEAGKPSIVEKFSHESLIEFFPEGFPEGFEGFELPVIDHRETVDEAAECMRLLEEAERRRDK